MAFSMISLTVAVIICVPLLQSTVAVKQYQHDELRRRAVGAAPEANKVGTPSWKPATGPREFTVNVDDNIRGANQHRHEKWHNGTVTGSYAAPGPNGKWLLYEYVADENGFRILSTKEVSPEGMMGDAAAKDNQANVNIHQDQAAAVKYTVTEEQLAKSKEKAAKEKQ